jgi:hypothetical protein
MSDAPWFASNMTLWLSSVTSRAMAAPPVSTVATPATTPVITWVTIGGTPHVLRRIANPGLLE